MIKLQNVSKFYYNKGVIAAGFSKVSLDFELGEFVAITGESGSGKSTLLNVISGLDSYEEGEMYVNGYETSHYLEKDWEDYRRKYIGNIYQNFNLINSYTVYQNIDLVLSLNGVSKNQRNKKILLLLKQVDMLKYKNTKVSKLSGGQKQRVAIARALAKDIPIIIADEPTGNLDKNSALKVVKLLKDISKDKLVIIVTHNYEQVSEYVTRKITMHDGKVIGDHKIKENSTIIEDNKYSYKNMKFIDKCIIGLRNTFNVLPKFILLLLVYSFIVCALMGEYSFFKKGEYEASKSGINTYFLDTNDHRVVINKNDKSPFSEEEINNLKNMDNIDYVLENDAITDQEISFVDNSEELWFSGAVSSRELLKEDVDVGRSATLDNEIVIEGDKDDYYLTDLKDDVINSKVYLLDSSTEEIYKDKEYTITGIKYVESMNLNYTEYRFYVSDVVLKDLLFKTHQSFSKITIDFMGYNHVSDPGITTFQLKANNKVTPGKAIISEDFNMYCDRLNCINKSFNVNTSNMYYSMDKSFIIEKIYNEKNMNYLLELPGYSKDNYDEFYNGIIYINPLDYNQLFNKGTYQISIYVKDIELLDDVISNLNNMGYHTLKISDTLVSSGIAEFLSILKFIVTCVLVFVLFFISYFIIRIILKSRNVYYAILRMLGASKSICRELLILELFIVSNISYFIFIAIAEINKTKYLNIGFINTVNTYFKVNDYIILYIVLMLMSLLISMRFSRKLFETSVMNAYREEV